MTPSDIIIHFERLSKESDTLSTTAQLDRYVLWISERWETLSTSEREVLLSVGAAVFRQWLAAAGTPVTSDDDPCDRWQHEGAMLRQERKGEAFP